MNKLIAAGVIGGIALVAFCFATKTEKKYATLDKKESENDAQDDGKEAEEKVKAKRIVKRLKAKAKKYKARIRRKLIIVLEKLTNFIVTYQIELCAYLAVMSGALDIIFRYLRYRRDTKVKIVDIGTF